MISIPCNTGSGGAPQQISIDTIGQGGGNATVSNFGAQSINLSIMDVQQTIQEGRAAGIKPFNIGGSTSMKNGPGLGQE